jgi:maltose alpha-D-glucosyltransferase/alpha-amylase
MTKWLDDAIFYQIYPQSFYDTNGDGIGDINGITQKLDYIKEMGFNAMWINPCFDSPFKDAGYDVRNYRKVAPRYGTNDDLKKLFEESHKNGIRVLLDLVPAHTSEEHPWFLESSKANPSNEFRNRYIWTDHCFSRPNGLGFIGGESERAGVYITSFFKCQPAVNFGFKEPTEKWQLPMNHPDCIASKEEMKDIMRFWLDMGCDGFRVDMAHSMIKLDDEKRTGTIEFWKDFRVMFDTEYPNAVLLAEWSNPTFAVEAGFHVDFLISIDDSNKGYQNLTREYKMNDFNEIIDADNSFFKKDAKDKDINIFLRDYLSHYNNVKNKGHVTLTTGNHDLVRVSYNLSQRETLLFYLLVFTLPSIPFLYYGDEIGMRYLYKTPTKEGGYYRTGSRTPMQWNNEKNLGFSNTVQSKLYLPIDDSNDAPNVDLQQKDKRSLLNGVKELIKLRKDNKSLQTEANLEILLAEKNKMPFVYKRNNYIIALNTDEIDAEIPIEYDCELIYSIGECSLENNICRVGAQSSGIWKIK